MSGHTDKHAKRNLILAIRNGLIIVNYNLVEHKTQIFKVMSLISLSIHNIENEKECQLIVPPAIKLA